ncbi:MAG: hypothetical protein ACYTJ0_06110, partial [Planctomycetota bacterium]
MWIPEEGRFRFTAFAYRQSRAGVPVFRSRLVLLVRDEPGHPLVLASADLRDLGGLVGDPAALPPAEPGALRVVAQGAFGPDSEVVSTDGVIWAGLDDQIVVPRLAHRSLIAAGPRRWLMVTDAFTGELLYEEDRLFRGNEVTGTVQGLVTDGVGSEQCEEEVPRALPYARITAGPAVVFSESDGSFSVPIHDYDPVEVTASLEGLWFDVINVAGAEASATTVIDPSGSGELLLNEANQAFERAEVNAFLGANELRDVVLLANPAYPGVDGNGFTVRVNRSDSLCPGNAWYSPDEQSINFCQAGGGHPNTAWSSVVYHEYGHHLVAVGGSGQGAYGEGMGDALSVVMLDSPELGLGFYGSCFNSLRDADNDCQYQSSGCSSCGSSSHSCGQLLSGCVWDLREELVAVDPTGYLDTLRSLVINSILLHTGSSINAEITVDFLTLDDDNGDIGDGTPHYQQIANAFGAHGMPAPPLSPLGFGFPDGLPTNVSPWGDGVIRVEIFDLGAVAAPGTGMLHLSPTGEPDTFVATPMTEVAPNVYEATFPENECAALTHYYFSAETDDGSVVTYPAAAPLDSFSVVAATDAETTFADALDRAGEWTVEIAGGLTDGAWEIGVPAGGGDRGDPPTDADGSGGCALTDNVSGNSDVDNGLTTLTSPTMDASVEIAYVSYWRWYSNSSGTGAYQDTFVVQVSDDGGASWVELETVGPDGPGVE